MISLALVCLLLSNCRQRYHAGPDPEVVEVHVGLTLGGLVHTVGTCSMLCRCKLSATLVFHSSKFIVENMGCDFMISSSIFVMELPVLIFMKSIAGTSPVRPALACVYELHGPRSDSNCPIQACASVRIEGFVYVYLVLVWYLYAVLYRPCSVRSAVALVPPHCVQCLCLWYSDPDVLTQLYLSTYANSL